ncbi:RNA-directed DNA polymerase, eukaryota, reverse transcriptase zinc-binding domain protein [Tanacetum coccineum]
MFGKVSGLGRQPSGRAVGDLTKLVTDLNGLTLDEAQDEKWEWALTSSRKFTVASLCRAIHLRVNSNDVSAPPFSWNSWVPRKVNVCAWRVALDQLPTRLNLCERGLTLHTSLFHAVCLSLIWFVWKWRNKIMHAPSDEEVSLALREDIFPAIQRLSLLWTSNRSSKCRATWFHWIRAPKEVAIL